MSSFSYHSLCYEGYDPYWILGKQNSPPAPPAEPDPPPPPTPAPPEENKDEPVAPPEPKPPEPIKLKVPFCCEGCEEKMRTVFKVLSGVESLTVDFESGLVIITGSVQSEECLNVVKKVVKRAAIL